MALQQEFTEQETKQLISDAVAKGNNFKVRVMRRNPSGGIKVIAMFEEATADQIAFAEKWLPELAGGGNYIIQAFHATESMKQIGGSLQLSIDNAPPHDVDTRMVNSPAWSGPTGLSYPKPYTPGQNGSGGMHFEGSGAEAIGPQRSSSSTPIGATPINSSNDPHVLLAERAQRAEQDLQQERTRNQIEAIKTATSQTVKTLEAQVQTLMAEIREERARASTALASAASAAPKESGTETIAKLIAALTPLVTPLVTTIMQGNNEMKLKMMDLEAKNAQATLEAARQASEQLNRILTTMMEGKGKIDPTMQLLFDQLKDVKKQDNPMVAMQSALQLITAARDAGFGGEGEKGLGDMVLGVTENLSRAAEAYFNSKAGQPAGQQQVVVPPQLPAAQRRVTAFQHLDRMIKSHHNVVETANFFLEGIQRDVEIRQRFMQAGQDIETFFKAHWAQWAMTAIEQHGPYIMALNEAVLKAAAARGMLSGGPAPQQPASSPAPTPAAPQAPQTAVQQAVAAMKVEPPVAMPVTTSDPGPGDEDDGEGDPEEPVDETEE